MGSVPLTPAPTNQNQFPATSPTRPQSNLMRLLPLWLCHLHQLVSILDSTNPWSSLPVKWQRGGSRARTMTLVFYPYRSAATHSHVKDPPQPPAATFNGLIERAQNILLNFTFRRKRRSD